MITVYLLWLSKIYNVSSDQLTLRVGINHLHKHREKEVLSFWSIHTNVPESQFTKTSFIKSKSKKVYQNEGSHFGTLRIKVKKSSLLRIKTLGAISHVVKESSNQYNQVL